MEFSEMSIKTAKSILRRKMKDVVDRISIEDRKRQSDRVHQKLFELPQYKASKRISLYLSTKDEIDTIPILRNIFESKKFAYVPRYQGKTMEMVRLLSMEDYDNLPLTKWNIKQPSFADNRENALETGLDLIIIPGVAFTETGQRLGHGMGYYDKFLSSIREASQKPYLIGVGFKEQVVQDLPTTLTDVDLDLVLVGESK